jgi:hypothetical protein
MFMTVVYRPRPAENGSVLVLEPPGVYERLFSRAVGPQETLVGELVLQEGRKRYEQVNFPMSSPGFLVADDEARRIIGPLLSGCGHWVPIEARNETDRIYAGFICTRQLAALAEGSEVSRLRSGAILDIRRLQLRDEVVRGVAAFVLSEWPRGPVYFSSEVVDAITAAGLTGLVWSEAWSNEVHR